MNARTLPMVDPMMIRQFTPIGGFNTYGGVIVFAEYEVEDIGLADSRLAYDAPVVDCSNRIFQLTAELMFATEPWALTACPSRRWRNFREGEDIIRWPDGDHPLLYIGNPVRVFSDPAEGISVFRIPEFLIKSGMELGY